MDTLLDTSMAILLTIIATCITILIILGLIIAIIEISDNVSSKRRNLLIKDLEDRMIGAILSNPDIEFISYDDSEFFSTHNDAAGVIQYKTALFNSKYKLLGTAKNFKIFIRKKDKWSWTVLAHEYGHYLSIKNYRDDSEEGADYEALKWLRQEILTPAEQVLLKLSLNIFFNESELKNYGETRINSLSTFVN